MTTIQVHDGTFHCDELAAIVIYSIFNNIDLNDINIIRSRKIYDADVVMDVGGVYDPANMKFDHHQETFNLKRSNGIKFASAGLVLRWVIMSTKDNAVWKALDKELIQQIDALDNGITICEPTIEKVFPVDLSKIINDFNATWDDETDRFDEALRFMEMIIKNKIKRIKAKIAAKDEYLTWESFENILVLPRFSPWQAVVVNNPRFRTVKFVIYPSTDKTGFKVQGAPVRSGDFACRAYLRPEWRGKESVEEIKTFKFCHMTGFIGEASTIEDAILMAKLSM